MKSELKILLYGEVKFWRIPVKRGILSRPNIVHSLCIFLQHFTHFLLREKKMKAESLSLLEMERELEISFTATEK